MPEYVIFCLVKYNMISDDVKKHFAYYQVISIEIYIDTEFRKLNMSFYTLGV